MSMYTSVHLTNLTLIREAKISKQYKGSNKEISYQRVLTQPGIRFLNSFFRKAFALLLVR